MNRRAFFAVFAGVAAALWRTLSRGLPPAADTPPDICVRTVRSYDPVNDRFVTRLDVLYGFSAIAPEYTCRIVGGE